MGVEFDTGSLDLGGRGPATVMAGFANSQLCSKRIDSSLDRIHGLQDGFRITPGMAVQST